MNYKERHITILLIIMSLMLSTAPAQIRANEKVVVQLMETAWVNGTDVLLGEIASITGDEEFVKVLSKVNTGRAPLVGTSRRLTVGQIKVRLRQAGIDVKEVEFAGPSEVQIFRGMLEEEDTPSKSPQFYQVVVVTRDVSRGEVLTASDLQIEEREVRGTMRDAGQIEDFVGLRAVRTLGAGTVLTPQAVEVVPTIERGAQVWIVAATNSIHVSVQGTARSNGNVGDIIPVENSSSRQIVYGEIVDEETVMVNIRGSSTP